MSEPKQVRAMLALQSLLQQIETSNTNAAGVPYRTNFGRQVMFGGEYPPAADCPLIQLFDGGDVPTKQPNPGQPAAMTLDHSFFVDLFAVIDRADPIKTLQLSRGRADVKNALLGLVTRKIADADGPIGPIRYAGAVPIEAPDSGGSVAGMRLTFTMPINEDPGHA